MKLIKRFFAVSAVAMAVVAAPVASATALFQGLYFTFIQTDADTLTFNIQGNPSGDWTGVQYLGAFDLKNLGLNFNTATGTANGPGAVNLLGLNSQLAAASVDCLGNGSPPGSICFDIDADTALVPAANGIDMTYTIDFSAPLNIDPLKGVHLQIAFMDDIGGAKVGSLYSRDVLLGRDCCQNDVPEPQPLALLGLGLFALVAIRRKFNT
jgi:hypothetical protein